MIGFCLTYISQMTKIKFLFYLITSYVVVLHVQQGLQFHGSECGEEY